MLPILLRTFELNYWECYKACKYNNDIYVSDYRENNIQKYKNFDDEYEEFHSSFVATCMLVNKDYLYYVPRGSYSKEINVYDLKNEKHHTVISIDKSINNIYCFHDRLYITLFRGFYIYSTTTHEFLIYVESTEHVNHINADETYIYISTNGILYIKSAVNPLKIIDKIKINDGNDDKIQESLITLDYIYIIKTFGDIIQINKHTRKIIKILKNEKIRPHESKRVSIFYACIYNNNLICLVYDDYELRYYDQHLNCVYKTTEPIFNGVEDLNIFDEQIYIFNDRGKVFVYGNYYPHHYKSLPQSQLDKIINWRQANQTIQNPIQKDLKYLFEKELLQFY